MAQSCTASQRRNHADQQAWTAGWAALLEPGPRRGAPGQSIGVSSRASWGIHLTPCAGQEARENIKGETETQTHTDLGLSSQGVPCPESTASPGHPSHHGGAKEFQGEFSKVWGFPRHGTLPGSEGSACCQVSLWGGCDEKGA